MNEAQLAEAIQNVLIELDDGDMNDFTIIKELVKRDIPRQVRERLVRILFSSDAGSRASSSNRKGSK